MRCISGVGISRGPARRPAPDVQTEVAHAFGKDARTDIEAVLVAPPAIEVAQPQPLERGDARGDTFDRIVREPASEDVVAQFAGGCVERQIERERFRALRRVGRRVPEHLDRLIEVLRPLRSPLEFLDERLRAAERFERTLRGGERRQMRVAEIRVAAM
jgi:hypothetical protein